MDISLPENLQQRLRWVQAPSDCCGGPGQFVLYWMHNALRAHENPALDTAICFARQNGLPLLVYHGLSEQYPYASDRHHAFMLQGHRDVQRELDDRGIVAAFHLQRHGQRGPYLRNLARSAAVLVTEEMPVQPILGWMERLSATCKTPIASVDCSCLAPVPQFDHAWTRAFEFRDAVKSVHDQALQQPYVEQPVDVAMCDLEFLQQEFQLHPLSLQDADLASLIGQCRIDHSVAPVADTPGGSKAGYARWEAFKASGLADYELTRNDPLNPSGSSRMSAYLHYGMVSPFRIAREAAEFGATKYLDELLTWRELAFHFCFHHTDLIDSLDAVPDWACKTLYEHESDKRSSDCSWETLARAKADHPLWNAAQRSLIKHGELHNNIRMTWGKAFLSWTGSPDRALQLTLDLNHRYALDGRNPSSYGGVLWCFGQFDRPFKPEQPIYGTVRTRELSTHAERLDVKHFGAKVDRPIAATLPKVAVVGAGMAGLSVARVLQDHGIDVTVFEQAEQVGGRIATYHAMSVTDSNNGSHASYQFDHGAQYFTACGPTFCRHVNSWIHDGIVQPWLGKVVSLCGQGTVLDRHCDKPRYVGVPSMDAITEHLAADLDVRLGHRVEQLVSDAERWRLSVSDGTHAATFESEPFDLVLCNCPPRAAMKLVDGLTSLAEKVRKAVMRPCWALMVADSTLRDMVYDAAFVKGGPIAWVASDGAKPGRPHSGRWIAHASADWSLRHSHTPKDEVMKTLLDAFASVIDRPLKDVEFADAVYWSDSEAIEPLDVDSLFDFTTGIGVCGDWCSGRRLESAFTSGVALAGSILRRYTIDRPAARAGRASQPRLFV
ncbi:FAD-dependent oxidoreductase [Rhodopirellula sp. MGV]|uniref:FAD-dependent oxidoreductase n=1 Tax=Rhodopirellula sp. MGV TaxID=2023130 RepID=UPI000B9765CA|nr:FAD-dependent oxidoreductase [Rhodopirellula sp. MGV]OYP30996.1 deoxyribodipyrimidine photolyase [Rhodopirellula sp. MGV]PNY34658.1 FAD-dependent oxidoreductase [Rhodopirellula baltica]